VHTVSSAHAPVALLGFPLLELTHTSSLGHKCLARPVPSHSAATRTADARSALATLLCSDPLPASTSSKLTAADTLRVPLHRSRGSGVPDRTGLRSLCLYRDRRLRSSEEARDGARTAQPGRTLALRPSLTRRCSRTPMANHVSTESKTDSDEPSRGVSPIATAQSVSPRCSPHPCGPPHDGGCLLRDRSPFLASLCSTSGGLPGVGQLSQRPAELLATAPTEVGAASPRIMSTSPC
jgi:hypothetical protein